MCRASWKQNIYSRLAVDAERQTIHPIAAPVLSLRKRASSSRSREQQPDSDLPTVLSARMHRRYRLEDAESDLASD